MAAFDAGAVDYVLKPVKADRLAQAVLGVPARLQAGRPPADLDALVQRLRSEETRAPPLRWISASVGDTIKLFGIDEVIFFQSDEKYTRVVTADDEAHVRRPLKEIAAGLDPERFWQVHRGVVVRADRIACAVRDELGRIQLQFKGHDERPAVSQAYAWRFEPM